MTLDYLSTKRPKLPIGSAKGYTRFCKSLCAGKVDFATARPDVRPTMITALAHQWQKDRYWDRMELPSCVDYAETAWDACLPVRALVSIDIKCRPDAKFACKVMPIATVLLFPFGCTISLSLRVTRSHGMDELPRLVEHLSSDRVYSVDRRQFTIHELVEFISAGIREDVFSGRETRTSGTGDLFTVTTVIDGGNELLAWRGIAGESLKEIQRIVQPTGVLVPVDRLDSMVRPRRGDEDHGNHNFVVIGPSGAFIWIADLLKTEKRKRNATHLRCYHNNTVRSTQLARQQVGLLNAVLLSSSELPNAVQDLAIKAIELVEAPRYRCAALVEFIGSKDVVSTVKRARTLLDLDGSATRKASAAGPDNAVTALA